MTIGMMIETMAGKACAVHGMEQDCTPFLFSEENRADDHVGEMLKQAGTGRGSTLCRVLKY